MYIKCIKYVDIMILKRVIFHRFFILTHFETKRNLSRSYSIYVYNFHKSLYNQSSKNIKITFVKLVINFYKLSAVILLLILQINCIYTLVFKIY